jgi:uncharacterized protein YbbC (DUF1343 family)
MKRALLFSIMASMLTTSASRAAYTLPVNDRGLCGPESFFRWGARKYRGKKCLLVTNHSGVDRHLNRNVDLLRGAGMEVIMIMAPEHGLYGYQNEYAEEMYLPDDTSGAIVYNLHKMDKKDFRYLMKAADMVIFDIQDLGMRCYTYISNLKFIMDAMDGSGKELIVLDRPNPLGFLKDDGSYLEEAFTTRFVSAFPAPFLYNMTMGEAARYYKGEFKKDVKLTVMPCVGYDRHDYFQDTALPWIPPSPNLPTYNSSIVYAAVVLMEGINLSLGRGTPNPFEYIGAPWIEPVAFCKGLSQLGLKNFRFRPVYFTPWMRKYKGEVCGGAHIIYTGGSFSATEVSYKIIRYIMETYPTKITWDAFSGKYEIDALAGTDKMRKALTVGLSFREYQALIEPGLEKYRQKRRKYILY